MEKILSQNDHQDLSAENIRAIEISDPEVLQEVLQEAPHRDFQEDLKEGHLKEDPTEVLKELPDPGRSLNFPAKMLKAQDLKKDVPVKIASEYLKPPSMA